MKNHRTIRDMIVFAMLGAMLFASKVAFEAFPNIHPVGMLVMAFTVVYRVKALIPLYLFVLLFGAYYGFSVWWIPYLYIWAVLWAATMLLPQNMKMKTALIVYPAVCGLFGLSYGTLYAPTQALLFGYDIATTLAWIAAGFPFDVIHALGNVGMGILVLPVARILVRLDRSTNY